MVDVANYGDDLVTAISQAPTGSAFWLEKPSYTLSATVPFVSGNRFVGSNRDLVVVTPGSGVSVAFAATVSSGTIQDVSWENLTVDCVAGPTGTVDAIALDTSASNTVVYKGISLKDINVRNARYGWHHDANNGNSGAMNSGSKVEGCRFENASIGVFTTGTYREAVVGNDFFGCTISAIGVGGTQGNPSSSGSGPTTLLYIVGNHIEGLGNLTGSGSATESGITTAGSQSTIWNNTLSNISRFPYWVQSGEGEGSVFGGGTVWGCGGPAVLADGSSSTQRAILADMVFSTVAQNANLNPNYGQRGAVSLGGGSWIVRNLLVADADVAGNTPPYALVLGFDASNQMGLVDVDGFSCVQVGTSWVLILNAQTNLDLRIRNSPGLNPAGASVPGTAFALAASGSDWTNTTGVDGTLYCTAAGTVTAVRVNGVSVAGSLGVGDTFPVPAGGKWGYTGTAAPTMVFVGN